MLYSDGVIECPDAHDEEFGIERLLDVCRSRIGAPAGEITNAIHDAMAAHRGRTAVADDATVLVVKRG